jgi:hypothetical protein
MERRKQTRAVALILACLVWAWGSVPLRAEEPVYETLPGPGKICRIGDAYSFTYEFDKTPKMGMVIVKVKLFERGGARTTELGLVGRADMPSMRGAHDTGEAAFQMNKKGDYLLPVNIVMPGEWEVRLVFTKGEEVVFRGALKFDV